MSGGHIPLSGNLHWNTPHWVRDGVYDVFEGPPDIDPCSNETSIMGASVEYKLPTNDGLVDPWNVRGPGSTAYINPPFGKSYMKPDRSDIIGAKDFQKLSDEEKANYSVHTSIADWVKRAYLEWRDNQVETIMLLPAAVDTKSWQDVILISASAVCFIKGRVRFLMPDGKPGGPAPMACALVFWGPRPYDFDAIFEVKGRVVLFPGGKS